VFAVQVAWCLYEMLPTGQFPCPFDFYRAAITAFVTTTAFYGINKLSVKKEEEAK